MKSNNDPTIEDLLNLQTRLDYYIRLNEHLLELGRNKSIDEVNPELAEISERFEEAIQEEYPNEEYAQLSGNQPLPESLIDIFYKHKHVLEKAVRRVVN